MNANQRRKALRIIFTEFRSMSETDKEKCLADLAEELSKAQRENDRLSEQVIELERN